MAATWRRHIGRGSTIPSSLDWYIGTCAALFVSLTATGAANAATGDRLTLTPKAIETFDGGVGGLEARYRLGISPWPNQVFTRTHVTSGEKQLWTGGDFLGLKLQPLYVKNGVVRVFTQPLPASALPIIAAKADAAYKAKSVTAKQAANIKAIRWSSGALASVDTMTLGYVGARMKLSPVAGRWQSFYIFDWSLGMEIDVIEAIGGCDGRCFHFSTHSPYAASQTVTVTLDQPLSAAYHEYGVRTTAHDAILYVDRVERARLPMPYGSASSKWNWVMNIAVGGNLLENPAYYVNNKPAPGSWSTTYLDEIVGVGG